MSTQTGNLYGTVVDNQGSALPGVTVILMGVGAPKVNVTNALGQFRYLNLAPATYSLEAQLEGFKTYEIPKIDIHVGRDSNVEVILRPDVE